MGRPTLSPTWLATFAANDGIGTSEAIDTSSPRASGSPTNIDATELTASQLTSIVAAAIAHWSDLCLNTKQLATFRNSSKMVAVFGATGLLGTAKGGRVITLDDNVVSFDWYADSKPLKDKEFKVEISDPERRPPSLKQIDLLTVVMHEMGHVLGLPDIDDHDSSGVMTDDLVSGTPRLCTAEDLAMLAFYLAQNSSQSTATSYDAEAIRAEIFSHWSPWPSR